MTDYVLKVTVTSPNGVGFAAALTQLASKLQEPKPGIFGILSGTDRDAVTNVFYSIFPIAEQD